MSKILKHYPSWLKDTISSFQPTFPVLSFGDLLEYEESLASAKSDDQKKQEFAKFLSKIMEHYGSGFKKDSLAPYRLMFYKICPGCIQAVLKTPVRDALLSHDICAIGVFLSLCGFEIVFRQEKTVVHAKEILSYRLSIQSIHTIFHGLKEEKNSLRKKKTLVDAPFVTKSVSRLSQKDISRYFKDERMPSPETIMQLLHSETPLSDSIFISKHPLFFYTNKFEVAL